MDQIKPDFLKKLTKLLVVSIWVLSILTTHNFYLYRFTVQLVTHALDKNYMFLLCNGLLVFVAKYSGLIASSKPKEENLNNTDKTFDYRDFESYNAILELEHSSVHGRATESSLAEEVSVEDDTKQEETEEKDEDDDEPLADNDGEEECDLGDGFINEEDEEEANVAAMTSTEEEMNKKFDEFIRKMKQELRIEAERHLILV